MSWRTAAANSFPGKVQAGWAGGSKEEFVPLNLRSKLVVRSEAQVMMIPRCKTGI